MNFLFIYYNSHLVSLNQKKKKDQYPFFAICLPLLKGFFILKEGIETVSLNRVITIREQCLFFEFSALIEDWGIIAGNEMLNSKTA